MDNHIDVFRYDSTAAATQTPIFHRIEYKTQSRNVGINRAEKTAQMPNSSIC